MFGDPELIDALSLPPVQPANFPNKPQPLTAAEA